MKPILVSVIENVILLIIKKKKKKKMWYCCKRCYGGIWCLGMKFYAYVLFLTCDDVNVIFLSNLCQVHVFELVKGWKVGIYFLCMFFFFFFKDNFNLWCLLLIITFYYQTKIPIGNDWNPDLLFEDRKIYQLS